ncbi:MAG: hypothetical protein D6B27_09890 [Gammaproteobacteria bacterium]|nr:MAG: hypothetical protein D6B27_09890 [Gammaproteobacteria bacterium]
MKKRYGIIAASLSIALTASAFGASYVAADNISKKVFSKTSGSTSDCDTEVRLYSEGMETRHRYLEDDGFECYTRDFYFDKAENSFELTGYISGKYEITYSPALPFIQEDMSVGSQWSEDITTTVNGSSESSTEEFEIVAIEDLSLDAGEFSDCPKLSWSSDGGSATYIWFCEDVGVVKWEISGDTWELESYSTDSLTVLSGSVYLQESEVKSKSFINTSAGGVGCDKETRTFSDGGETEERVYSNSDGLEIACGSRISISNSKTENSHVLSSQVYSGYSIDYAWGIPVIPANMAIGESWGVSQYVYVNDNNWGARNDSFTLEALEDVSVDGGNYERCLKVNWEGYSPVASESFDMTLWLCPEIGLAKYVKDGDTWEMSKITRSGTAYIGGSDGGGGGGSISLFVIFGVGLSLVVRRRK